MKNFRIFGAKKRDRKKRNTDPKMGPKTNPWRFLGYHKYKEGPFLGTVFWTPKMCSKAWFSGPFSGGLDFTRNAYIYISFTGAKTHPSIHPDNAGLPQLGISVAGRASYIATSRGKASIKANLLILVMQKAAYASVLDLEQAHNKPDS